MKKRKIWRLLLLMILLTNTTMISPKATPSKIVKDESTSCTQPILWNPESETNYTKGMCIKHLDKLKIVKQDFKANGDEFWFYSYNLFDDYYANEYLTKSEFETIYINIHKVKEDNFDKKAAKEYFQLVSEQANIIKKEMADKPDVNLIIGGMYESIIGMEIGDKDISFKIRIDNLLNEGSTLEDAILKLNPKIGSLSVGDFSYDETTGKITFNYSKDSSSSRENKSLYDSLSKGDILNNFSTGSGGVTWGHVGILWEKDPDINKARVVEALNDERGVSLTPYLNWHNNTWDKMAYSYLTSVTYGTDHYRRILINSADHTHTQLGKPYSIFGYLGEPNYWYCSELVYWGYYVNWFERIDLGSRNHVQMGKYNHIWPIDIYLDDDIEPFFKQNF